MRYKFTPKETIALENLLQELDRNGQLPKELSVLQLSVIDWNSPQRWM